jgi:hypothetical protein
MSANYTWASAYSYTGQADLLLPTSVQDIYNVRADRGRPDDFVRHNFSADFIYEVPFGRWTQSNSGLVRNTLRGWQVSGVFLARSGTPLNITQSSAFEGSRADYVGGQPTFSDYQDTLRYINRSAFAPVPIGAQSGVPIRPGNIGRNALTNVGWWNLDLSAAKRFFITEKFEGKLEAQMLNSLNPTNFNAVATNIVASNFGMFTSTRGARVIQLNLRLAF